MERERYDASGYKAFWNGGPRTVCSVATEGFGVLDDEHHAAARAAAEAWNEAVGGQPALFAYQRDCPDDFDAVFDGRDHCGSALDYARGEFVTYIPVIWVAAEAATGVWGHGLACAYIIGAHNENPDEPLEWQGWKAAVIIGGGSTDYARTISHELGHILYLDHTCNARSIMYASSSCAARYESSGIIPADYLQIRETLGRN